MSNDTLERGKTTNEHPPERKAKLKKARMSERAELDETQMKAIDELPEDASSDAIAAAVAGKAAGKARQVKVKYSEDVQAAYRAALELTGTPEKGGPKYALTPKQTDAMKRALAAKGKGVAEVREALGKVSDTALRKIAKGQEPPVEAVKAVRAFLKAHPALRDDRTMYARKGAAIVLALRDAELARRAHQKGASPMTDATTQRGFVIHTSPTTVDAELARRRILFAVAKLAARAGDYRQVKVTDIVREARVGRATLYKMFDGLDDVLSQAVAFAAGNSFNAVSLGGLRLMVGNMAKDPAMSRLLLVEGFSIDPVIVDSMIGDLAHLLSPDPGVAEEAAVGGMTYMLAKRLNEGRADELPELVPDLLRFLQP